MVPPHCFNDAGFAAIGLGAGHASLSLAQAIYTNFVFYSAALASVYSAKKAAETAPGVGPITDMHIVTRAGVWPVVSEIFERLEQIYREYAKERELLADKSVAELGKFIAEQGEKMSAALAVARRGQEESSAGASDND